MQPELQVTDGVAAQVLQLHRTTHSDILNDICLVLLSGGDESQLNYFLACYLNNRRAPRLLLLLP